MSEREQYRNSKKYAGSSSNGSHSVYTNHKAKMNKKDVNIESFMFKKNCPNVYLIKLRNLIHRLCTGEEEDYFNIQYTNKGFLDVRKEIAETLLEEYHSD